MDQAEWFAVDWGTTHLRVWVFGPDERLLTCLTSDKGMSKLKPHDFEPVLLDLIASYLGQGVCPVIACGMVGARQGCRWLGGSDISWLQIGLSQYRQRLCFR